MKTARLRPSKPISAIIAVPASVFAAVGLAGTITIFGWFPQIWPIGLFLCLWTVVVGSIAGFHWMNVFSSSGVSIMEADFQATSEAPTSAMRLAELQGLLNQGLISDEEYRQKRDDVIKNI